MALPALLLILAALWRQQHENIPPQTRRLFYLLPALLIALPLLQLIPLPLALWAQLPGRAAVLAGLQTAGVQPAWSAWTLAPLETERLLEALLVPASLFMATLLLAAEQRRQLVTLALAFAALSALLGFWQRLDGPDGLFFFYRITNLGEAVGFFANRNHLASLLLAALPLAVGSLSDHLRHNSQGIRDLRTWLLNALIVLLIVGVTATRSRAVFLLLMASVAASAAVLWRSRRHRSGQKSHTARWLRLTGLLATVLVVQFTLYAMLVRLQTDPLEDFRWTRFLPDTLTVAATSQGTGFGLGSFLHAYELIGDASALDQRFANHAHNDYAELWLEAGVPALLLMLAALAAIAWLVFHQWRLQELRHARTSTPRDRHRGFLLGAAFALALLALHSAVDYPLRTMSLQAYAALLVAVLVGSLVAGPVQSAGHKQAAA